MPFCLVDASKPKLSPSPSPLIINAWSRHLLHYHEPILRIHLVILLRFGCLVDNHGPDAFIFSNNLSSALMDSDVIDKSIAHNLRLGRRYPAPTIHLL